MSDKLKRASGRGLSGWWGCPTASLGFGDMANFRVQNGWVLCLTWVCFWYVVCRTGQNEVDGKIERKEGGLWRRGERGKKTRWKGRKGREGGEKGVWRKGRVFHGCGQNTRNGGGDLPWPQFHRIHSEAMFWGRTSRQQGVVDKQLSTYEVEVGARIEGWGEWRAWVPRTQAKPQSRRRSLTHPPIPSFICWASLLQVEYIVYTEPPVFLTVVLKSELSRLQPKHICFSLL